MGSQAKIDSMKESIKLPSVNIKFKNIDILNFGNKPNLLYN